MIYNQSFTVKQYAEWLPRNHAVFAKFEERASDEALREVYDADLLRTKPLEADLSRYLGPGWREEAGTMAQGSPATKQYLAHLEADVSATPVMLLAHHFLQYNAVLSGGACLGEMVSQK